MSKFTTVYDQIVSTLETLFADKIELTNPDNLLEFNTDQELANGFGVIIGPASPESFDYSEYYESREFTIVFTEEVIYLEGDEEAFKTVKKALIEDTVTLKQDFLANDQIGVGGSIQIINLVTSSGVDLIPGTEKTLTTSVTFSIGISETINT